MMNFDDHANIPSRRGRIRRATFHIGMAVVFAASLVFIFGYVVMLLWNGVLPALLSIRHIAYWQSVGLLLLTRILVGGFQHGKHGGGRFGHGAHRRQYDDWWNEVGQQSYRNFASNRSDEK